jgi:hypothetical protein
VHIANSLTAAIIILLVDIAMMKQQNIKCMIMICAAIITNDDRLAPFIIDMADLQTWPRGADPGFEEGGVYNAKRKGARRFLATPLIAVVSGSKSGQAPFRQF